MSVLAQQFGPTLLIATLVAPLIVLAVFFVPALRALARAITPLAAQSGERVGKKVVIVHSASPENHSGIERLPQRQ